MSAAQNPGKALPDGEYCIVEIMGHATLVGRYAEVERFGTKMLAIEPLYCGTLLPAVFHGGQSIYRLTPCSREVAQAKQPTRSYQLPAAILCIVPPALLEGPEPRRIADLDEFRDDEADGDTSYTGEDEAL